MQAKDQCPDWCHAVEAGSRVCMEAKDQCPDWCHAEEAGNRGLAMQAKDQLVPRPVTCCGGRQYGVGMQAKDQLVPRPVLCCGGRQSECVWKLKTNAQTGAMLRRQAIWG